MTKSPEWYRIQALPRRVYTPTKLQAHWRLRPIQDQALVELAMARGLFGSIRVGGGKTLISYLAPRMTNAKRPLLLVPGKLLQKTTRDFKRIVYEGWPRTGAQLMSYEYLSRNPEAIHPHVDMIIADEMHKLSSTKAGCSRRVNRHMNKHPDTVFCGLSGSVVESKITDFATMMEWALGDKSPLPIKFPALVEWKDNAPEQWLAKRMRDTLGVVFSPNNPLPVGIELTRVTSPLHPDIKKALYQLRSEWKSPDGEDLIYALDVHRHAMTLAQGFYYVWKTQPPEEWLLQRKLWASFVRNKLTSSRKYDTEKQIREAYPDEARAWVQWKNRFRPDTIPVVLNLDSLLTCIRNWRRAHQERPGIVWTNHRAIGYEIGKRIGAPYFGSHGLDAEGNFIDDYEGRVLVASIKANYEGRNLQRYAHNFVCSPPASGRVWEQLIGRTHREGQTADTVTIHVYCPTHETQWAMDTAIDRSHYIEAMTKQEQKLAIATKE